MTKRQKLQLLHSQLKSERESWIPLWRDLSDYFLPRRSRFLTTDRNRGDIRNTKILDSTPTFAARTLASGMMTGITSPARPWFRLTTPDPDLAEFGPVKEWLHLVLTRMTSLFLRSNLYNVLPQVYLDQGVFGTSAMAVMEDDRDVMRCYSYPIGSYMLASNHRGNVDTFVREFSMTVRQLIDMFGEKNVSRPVLELWRRGQTSDWIDVVHVVHPNPDADPDRIDSRFKPWISCYFEPGAQEDKFLRESGFDEFPILAPRWATTGEDVYGTSPGMEALPDNRGLQTMQKRSLQILDKLTNPPMMAPTSLQNKTISLLPGAVTFVDAQQQAQGGFRPAHDINPGVIEPLEGKILQHQQRINRAFYVDLFLMLAMDNRQQPSTAREIQERHEEKLLMLGPVLERQNDDLLDPLIDRAFAIMARRGLLPPPPPELQGVDLRVEYVSILAQAQKMVGTSSLQRLTEYVGGLATIDPQVLDKFDRDQAVDEYADMLGVPPKVVRSDEDVLQIRQQRARQQQAQQAAMAAAQMAQTAKTLSEADTSGDNALTRIAGAAGVQ